MKLVFSHIDEDDLPACSELYAATFRRPPWNEEWRMDDAFERLSDFLANPKSIAMKVLHDEDICGFVFGKIQRWSGSTSYDLEEICVRSDLQKKGVGKKLMGRLEEVLVKKEVSKIHLITQRDSVPASFYSSLGFSEIQDLVIMERKVERRGW